MTDRKKPGLAFWATVVLVVVLVGYPLSHGPLCWLGTRGMLPEWANEFFVAYDAPLEWAFARSKTVFDLYSWYTSFWRYG